MEPNYYVQTKRKWMRLFDSIANNEKHLEIFQKYYNDGRIDSLKHEIRNEFERLLPQIPFIGGDKSLLLTTFLVQTALSLSFYRILKSRGTDLHKIGEMLYDIGEVFYDSMSPIAKLYMRFYYHSPFAQISVQKRSEERHKRGNPYDYQGEFVKGDGKNLLFGYNYTECGGVKFLKSQNAEELAPYLCLGDYALFRAIKTGFKRTQNIALGAPICDFQFLKDFETPRGWPLENVEEYQNFARLKRKS